jgi:hypothetical protein
VRKNLNDLANELSRLDDKGGKNLDAIDVKIVLSLLRQRLRTSNAEECIGILTSLLENHPTVEFSIRRILDK